MKNISGFGTVVQIRASNTFPIGFPVTQFADDADSLDIPSVQIADKASGLNGDLVAWSKANPIPVTLNIIPNSDDDKNLSILFEANRVSRGKRSANDVITMTVIYPDGSKTIFKEGIITDGMPGRSISNAQRQKTKAYVFAFEGVD
jgi:hypothetical protein